MEEFINSIVKLPLASKIGILVGAIVAVSALNYFVWPGVSDIQDKIARSNAAYAKLQEDLVKKKAIANNLNQYRRDLEVLEQRLKEALTEMPEEVKMDDLLAQLSDLARKAGLSMSTINPQQEKQKGFYFEIPIKMGVKGNYHEVAVFLDSLSKLKRIVNVNNIQLGQPNTKAEKIIIEAQYMATTFRFAPASKDTGKKDDANSGRRRRRAR